APLVAAWLLGAYVRTRREYLRAVEERAAQLEREQEANAHRAAAEEQARIAREVHDVVAHNLSVIIVQAAAADEVFASDPADAQRAVRTIGSSARRALDELRYVLGASGQQPRLAPQPTLGGLEALLGQVRAVGLGGGLEIVGELPELPPALELSAYRIVQEALTNTLRHAGAEHATVTLRFDPEAVTVDVLDDGSAPQSVSGNGRGLIGMRERVTTFGGHLEADPTMREASASARGYRWRSGDDPRLALRRPGTRPRRLPDDPQRRGGDRRRRRGGRRHGSGRAQQAAAAARGADGRAHARHERDRGHPPHRPERGREPGLDPDHLRSGRVRLRSAESGCERLPAQGRHRGPACRVGTRRRRRRGDARADRDPPPARALRRRPPRRRGAETALAPVVDRARARDPDPPRERPLQCRARRATLSQRADDQ